MNRLFAYSEKMEEERRNSRVENKIRNGVRLGPGATNNAQNVSMYLFSLLLILCDVL